MARKLFSLYTMGENEGKMAMLDATNMELKQVLSRASLLLGINASTTKLSASFYGPDSELRDITDDAILACVPCGATLFIKQEHPNGSPKSLTRRLSVLSARSSVDSLGSDGAQASSVPPSAVQMDEEQHKILKHLEDQLHTFEQSLGSLSTDPTWRQALQTIHRAIQKCVLRAGDVSEELSGIITAEGAVSPSASSLLPPSEQLDLYAQHCLQDLLHALAALKTAALGSSSSHPPPASIEASAPASASATRNPSVTCGA